MRIVDRILPFLVGVALAAVLVVSVWAWRVQSDAHRERVENDRQTCAVARAARADLRSSLNESFGLLIDRIVANTSDPAEARPIGDQLKADIRGRLTGALGDDPAACLDH